MEPTSIRARHRPADFCPLTCAFGCGRDRRRSDDLALFSCPHAHFGGLRRTAMAAKGAAQKGCDVRHYSATSAAFAGCPRDLRGIGALPRPRQAARASCWRLGAGSVVMRAARAPPGFRNPHWYGTLGAPACLGLGKLPNRDSISGGAALPDGDAQTPVRVGPERVAAVHRAERPAADAGSPPDKS